MSQIHQSARIIVALLLISSGLIFLDLQIEKGEDETFISILDTIKTVFSSERYLNASVLDSTSLSGESIVTGEKSKFFFTPYLKLPEGVNSQKKEIQNTSITISEVSNKNPKKLIKELLKQKKPLYQFNIISDKVFYLNQLPAEQRTHNFLAIAIGHKLYGFTYKPQDHPKVLEIIDALQKKM